MPVVRWDPLRDLVAIHDRMNRLFEAALTGTDFPEQSSGVGTWSPIADVYETEESVLVTCEVPGLAQEDIEIKLADNVLSISGERRVEKGPQTQEFHRIERAYGPFSRNFTVPASIDAGKIAASYRDGVLSVSLPKRAEATPRRITVRIS
jgi:HSP20 family protein